MPDISGMFQSVSTRSGASASILTRALVSLIHDPDHGAADVVDRVERDASLTIRILRIANSPVIAPISPIQTLDHAIALMGEDVVVTAALAVGANWMHEPISGYGPDARIFENGLKTAIAAKLIAKRSSFSERVPLAYTGGLLHDIGKIVLSKFMQPGLSSIIEDVSSGHALDWLAAEKEVMGVDHCEVGALVADQFNLGPALRAIIEHHHGPAMADPAFRPLVKIVHAADAVRAMMGGDGGADSLSYPVEGRVLEDLGIGPRELGELICDTLSESETLLDAVLAN